MPIPGPLVALTLSGIAAGDDTAAGLEKRWERTQAALDQLRLQRKALLSRELPRLLDTLERVQGSSALETYRETLTLLSDSEDAAATESVPDETLHDPTPTASTLENGNLFEAIRLRAIERASADGVRRFARARTRISTVGRRIDARASSDQGTRSFERLLVGSASLAATAAAAATQPVVAADGGLDRRFLSALGQFRS
jgi:hypothetical protein